MVHVLEEGRNDRKFIIDIEDTTSYDEKAARVELKATYKQRVIDYLASHNDNETLNKIQNFEQLTSADIEELQRIFGRNWVHVKNMLRLLMVNATVTMSQLLYASSRE